MAKQKHETATENTTTTTTALSAPPEHTEIEMAADFGEDAGAGFDNFGAGDMLIPQLVLVQDKAKAIKNGLAKARDILLTSTGQTFSQVEVVPAITDHCFVEWVPRESGGGFRGRHSLDSQIVKDTLSMAKQKVGKHATYVRNVDGKLVANGETELIETFEVWCVIADNGKPIGYGLFSCSSMKIKPYKVWTNRMRAFQIPSADGKGKQDVPMFANRTIVRVVDDKNQKGEFFNFSFDPYHPADTVKIKDAEGKEHVVERTALRASMLTPKSALYQAGKELRDLVLAKKVTADYAAAEQDAGPEAAHAEGAAAF